MSVMLTLISTRPIFFSSGSSEFCTCDEERIAVAVDVFDPHRGDHLPQLAEDDFLRPASRSASALSPSKRMAAFCITSGVRADGDGEHARHVDADVLGRQRAAERNFDLDRFQAQVGVVLNQRPDERRAAVQALRRFAAAGLAVDHQHAVARAAFDSASRASITKLKNNSAAQTAIAA